MKKFISCDWGTSSLRIRLFDPLLRRMIALESGKDGILSTHEGWKNSGSDPETRLDYYRSVLSDYVLRLQARVTEDLRQWPIIISGMASSSIGLCPLPYSVLPFSLSGEGLQTRYFERQDAFNAIFLISGVRSSDDVMRGEETELIGLAELDQNNSADGLYIFPGTHSKHITVKNKRTVEFRTFMTGEVFALLSEKSILRSAMHACDFGEPGAETAFARGIGDAANYNLLHRIFSLRANELFGIGSPGENFYYLSGLLIGYELSSLHMSAGEEIVLCSQGRLNTLYQTALRLFGHEKKTRTFSAETADIAVAVGQFKIYQKNT
jgi:2-dehydro-3-deoxygalactonokinase